MSLVACQTCPGASTMHARRAWPPQLVTAHSPDKKPCIRTPDKISLGVQHGRTHLRKREKQPQSERKQSSWHAGHPDRHRATPSCFLLYKISCSWRVQAQRQTAWVRTAASSWSQVLNIQAQEQGTCHQALCSVLAAEKSDFEGKTGTIKWQGFSFC